MTFLRWINKDGTLGERVTYGKTLAGLKQNLERTGAVIIIEETEDQYKKASLH